jgi:hypothetical protein
MIREGDYWRGEVLKHIAELEAFKRTARLKTPPDQPSSPPPPAPPSSPAPAAHPSPPALSLPDHPTAGKGAIFKVEAVTQGGRKTNVISVDGELQAGDGERFADVAISVTNAVIVLNSPGGDLVAGIEIGKAIRLKGFRTAVPQGFSCASACALAWLGGSPRFMGQGSTIGFHAAYANKNGAVSSVGNAMVGAYLNQLGLPLCLRSPT